MALSVGRASGQHAKCLTRDTEPQDWPYTTWPCDVGFSSPYVPPKRSSMEAFSFRQGCGCPWQETLSRHCPVVTVVAQVTLDEAEGGSLIPGMWDGHTVPGPFS